MLQHSETKIFNYTQEQLFNLVLDVEKYPEFLPKCKKLTITSRGNNSFDAILETGSKFGCNSFVSRVHFLPSEWIEIEYLKGPMRALQCRWDFKALPKSKCEVSFSIEFSMSNKLIQLIVNQIFELVLLRMVSAFEARANEIYGSAKSKKA